MIIHSFPTRYFFQSSKVLLLILFWTGVQLNIYSQVTFIADPNPDTTTQASRPNLLYEWKGYIYFNATTTTGNSLWRTDGTEKGTQRVLDGITVREIYGDEDNLWLGAHTQTTGTELWRGDGSPYNFHLIKDFKPGSSSSYPSDFITINSLTFFIANIADLGRELWVSDGTIAGTHLVKDLNPGKGGSNILTLTSFQNQCYFILESQHDHWELWKSDGSASGTVNIISKPFNANRFKPAGSLLAFQNELFFFAANDSVWGLWKSDGSDAGTEFLVSTPDTKGQFISHPTKLLFLTSSPSNRQGTALWEASGEKWNLELLYDFGSFSPDRIMPFNGSWLLAGSSSFWITDGTRAGTRLLKEHTEVHTLSDNWVNLGRQAVISYGQKLWVTDGTESNTRAIENGYIPLTNFFFLTYAYNVAGLNGMAFFPASFEAGYGEDIELWKSDGTDAGTGIFKDLFDVPLGASMYLEALNEEQMFFRAESGSGIELWRSDGTAEGSYLVKDICKGPDGSRPNMGIFLEKEWYFSASECDSGQAKIQTLWKTDGTASGTVKVSDIQTGGAYSSFSNKVQVNGKIFFSGSEIIPNTYSDPEPWVSDGTASGTFQLKNITQGSGRWQYSDPVQFTAIGNHVIFSADERSLTGRELWISDGSKAGTKLVKDIYSGQRDGLKAYRPFFTLKDKVIFQASSKSLGEELWTTDGRPQATSLLKDINEDVSHASPFIVGRYMDKIIIANQILERFHIWLSDGTPAGTNAVPDMDFAYIQPIKQDFMPEIDYLLFGASKSKDIGTELWRTDGTPQGTYQLTQIALQRSTSLFSHFIYFKGLIYFLAKPGGSDRNTIWQTDGTPEGTYSAEGSDRGDPYFNPKELFLFKDELYFIADHPGHGESLFRFKPLTRKNTLKLPELKIFPNPATSLLHVSWPEMLEQHATFTFFDIQGRKAYETVAGRIDGTGPFLISLNGIQPGAYFLHVEQEKQRLRGKLIVF